jgi:hypothetical protein
LSGAELPRLKVETLLQVLGYLSIPVLLVAIRVVLRVYRRRVRLDVPALVVPPALGVAMLCVYLPVLSADTRASGTLMPFLVGLVAGVAMSRGLPLASTGNDVVGVRPQWPLIVWGAALGVAQLLALASPLSTGVGVAFLLLATGYLAGENGGLLFRRNQMLEARSPTAGGLVACIPALLLLVTGGGSGILAQEEVSTLNEVFAGEVDGLKVEISGTGRYFGDAIDLRFTNTTDGELQVHVPIGVLLAPDDDDVQTMVTAGGETLVVPTEQSITAVRAFCAEAREGIPSVADFFEPRGRANADLVRTLERINELGEHNEYGQAAVWSHTDDADLSDNDPARALAVGHGPSPGGAGAAGILMGLMAAAAAYWADRDRDTLILSGGAAQAWLNSQRADWPQPTDVVSISEGGVRRTFLRPPAGIPDQSLGIAFETRSVPGHGDLIPQEDLTIVRERHRPTGQRKWDTWDPSGSGNPVDEIVELFDRYDIPCETRVVAGERVVVAPVNLSDRADAMAFEAKTEGIPGSDEEIRYVDVDKPVTVIGVPGPVAPPPPTPIKPQPVKPTPVGQAPVQPVQPQTPPVQTPAVQPPHVQPTPARQPPSSVGQTPATTSTPAVQATGPPAGFDPNRFANATGIGVAALSDVGRRNLAEVVQLLTGGNLKLPDLSDRVLVRDFVREKLANADAATFQKICDRLESIDLDEITVGYHLPESLLTRIIKGPDLPLEKARRVTRGIQSLSDGDFTLLKKTIGDLRRAAGIPDPPPKK